MGFTDFVGRYQLARSEGLVLRYLTDAYRTLRQTVPEAHRTPELDDLDRVAGGDDPPDRLVAARRVGGAERPRARARPGRAPRAAAAAAPDQQAGPHLRGDGPQRDVGAGRPGLPRRPRRPDAPRAGGRRAHRPPRSVVMGRSVWDAAIEDYYAEHDTVLSTATPAVPTCWSWAPSGRVSRSEPRRATTARVRDVRQTIHDPEGHHDWVIDARHRLRRLRRGRRARAAAPSPCTGCSGRGSAAVDRLDRSGRSRRPPAARRRRPHPARRPRAAPGCRAATAAATAGMKCSRDSMRAQQHRERRGEVHEEHRSRRQSGSQHVAVAALERGAGEHAGDAVVLVEGRAAGPAPPATAAGRRRRAELGRSIFAMLAGGWRPSPSTELPSRSCSASSRRDRRLAGARDAHHHEMVAAMPPCRDASGPAACRARGNDMLLAAPGDVVEGVPRGEARSARTPGGSAVHRFVHRPGTPVHSTAGSCTDSGRGCGTGPTCCGCGDGVLGSPGT